MSHKVMQKLQDRFFEELDKKTNWGKEQLKVKYLEIKAEVLSQELDETTRLERDKH